MSDTPGLLTATAISLALLAAVGFGIAAVRQQRVVAIPPDSGTTQPNRLGVHALWALAHQRSGRTPRSNGLRMVNPWTVGSAAATVVDRVRPDVVHIQSHILIGRQAAKGH